MRGFDFFRKKHAGYVPRTPGTALRAVGSGAAQVEDFIWRSTSIKPLDEMPFDLEAIERTLANPALELETAKLLMGIFQKMIQSPDRQQETALFGAEGINALESRYVKRVEGLKEEIARLDATTNPTAAQVSRKDDAWRDLARAYYELAELHSLVAPIRAFYLREAYSAVRVVLRKGPHFSTKTMALTVDILVGLGLYAQAAHWLQRIRPQSSPLVTYHVARIAFHMRNYKTVKNACGRLAPFSAELRATDARPVTFWAEL